VSAVEALYTDARSLFVGVGSAAAAAFVTYWKSGDWTLLLCAALIVIIGLVRFLEMRSFRKREQQALSVQAAQKWETRYIIASAGFVLLLGIWVLLAFARTKDPTVQLISFSMTLVYLLGISGRNFSSERLVLTQTVCAAVPMMTGLLVQNEIYHLFLAVLFIPFFLGIRIISARLRATLFNAVIATHEVKALAVRFDTALNNMPHGLCMFDADLRFVVANERFAALLGISGAADRRGRSAINVLKECARLQDLPESEASRFTQQFKRALSGQRRDALCIETGDGLLLEVTFQQMDAGGCVVLVEDVTERRGAEAKIERLARYDALTGLPNRTFFTERLEQRLAGSEIVDCVALLFIDLDGFKQVNDTLGHPYGDSLLCEVADRFRKAVDEDGQVARFGGDEFVVLQPVADQQEASALARKIIDAVREIYDVDGHQIMVGASIGIAMTPQDGTTVDQLLKSADMALYRSKAEGRGVWRFFEPGMETKAHARREFELSMRGALARGEFQVHYQPIVEMRTGRVALCEALLRWHHPEHGMISPAEFIPVAEETGLIVELGRWVLEQACSECAQWPPEVRVAVNLSAIQFRRTNVAETISAALNSANLSADRLEVEITETVLLQDNASTRAALQSIRDLGVSIALDDFGTGFSSLSYLQAFPLDKVKIDRSFLLGIEVDQRPMTLLRGVARLSSELGLAVVIEGVETHQQLAMLTPERSVSHVQGFLFSRPLPTPKIRHFLQEDRGKAVKVA
jgi:diguanylate cyclase (GGDEF)-like protein